jgi:type I restriction enzyme S subunit
LKKVKAQLKRYRQAVLKYAFEGKLTQEWREANKDKLEPASALLERIKKEREKQAGRKFKELPPIETADLQEKWVWARLGLCSNLITKGESPNWQGFNYVDEGIPFIRSENVLWGKINISDVAKIPEEFHKKLKRSQIKRNDVLINLVGASIGRCCVVPSNIEEANINQAVALIRVKEILTPAYLLNLLLSPNMQKVIHAGKVETARPNISLGDLSQLVIPLPSPPEQKRIVEEIESRFSVADTVDKIAEQTLNQSEKLRKSILKTAFEGKLVPQDPTDEPAEKLLERIKAEKAKRESETKGRRKKSNQMELI